MIKVDIRLVIRPLRIIHFYFHAKIFVFFKLNQMPTVPIDAPVDVEPPVIKQNGKILPKYNSISQCQTWNDPGAVAEDNIDSKDEITSKILTGGIEYNADLQELDTTLPLISIITYDVTDSAGNKAETKSR